MRLDPEDLSRGVLFTATDITERKQTEQRIAGYQRQLKSLASRLTLTEEHLKRTIATHIHDTLSQTLAMLKVKVGLLGQSTEDPRIKEVLMDIYEHLEGSLEQAQVLTSSLSYPTLNVLGFEKAVAKWLKEEIQTKHGLVTMLDDDGQPKPLHQDVKAVLFRAVRETLANVVKHAQAHRVDVSIRRDEGSLIVTLQDDGRGFDPGQVRELGIASQGGFGILSIHEAMEGLGGALTLQSCPGKGCRVVLVAPLKHEAKDPGRSAL